MNFPWFRLWTKFRTDPAVQMLAFEDQRHFIIAMCMKCEGILDKQYASTAMRSRVICQALGLDQMAAGEANRRLREAGLIDEEWQPVSWDKNQPVSDHNAAERKRRQRDRDKGMSQDVTVTGRDSHALDTDTELEEESESESREETHGLLAQPGAKNSARKSEPPGFDQFRELYPKRSGSQRWQDAESHYRARLREGSSVAEILDGVRRYAAFVRESGIEGTSRVQQAATFVGTNRCYVEEWKPEPAVQPRRQFSAPERPRAQDFPT